MFTLKASILLGAPLLAAASDILPSRIQRRHALLELLQHNHEKRDENYGVQNVCTAQPGENQATFLEIDVGVKLVAPLNTYDYQITDASCFTLEKCQNACIVDGEECMGLVFNGDSSSLSCTLLGSNFGGPAISYALDGTMLLQNAGTTTPSSGDSEAHTVATCATQGTLDTVAANGACICGTGRSPASSYTCAADPVPAGAINPATPPVTIQAPVTFSSAITWSSPETGVPAVMTTDQCTTICAQDTNCQAFLLVPGTQLSDCYKIGGDGIYSSPAGFPFTPASAASRFAKRANGQPGQVGGAGDVLGQLSRSTLTNSQFPANAQASGAGARRMRVKRSSAAQW